jgi:hypothetical protein
MIAFRERISPVGQDTIVRAADDDPAANNAIGQFLLRELDDPIGAQPYLERAAAGGIFEAILELAAIKLLPGRSKYTAGLGMVAQADFGNSSTFPTLFPPIT